MQWFHPGIQTEDWLWLAVVAVLIGMAKTGVNGAGMLAVPLLSGIFGSRASSGVMLPMLLLADLAGVWYYHRHASWPHLKRLLPWAAAGVIIGTMTGTFMDEILFRQVMAWTILASLAVMVWLETGNRSVPETMFFSASSGVLGGFTSMVGNLANSVMAVCFLSVRMPKNVFIGTTAWFFMAVNAFKVPFHVFAWGTIDGKTVLLAAVLLPAILAGAVAGVWVVKGLPEKAYRWFLVAVTAIAAVSMMAA